MSLEILSQRFPGRTWGVDLWNPTNHPLIKQMDVRSLEDIDVAYVHCNVGNFNLTPVIRKFSLEWSLRNLVSGGWCITAGNHPYVENYLGYTIESIAKQHNCELMDIPVNEHVEQMNALGRTNSAHDCLIKKR